MEFEIHFAAESGCASEQLNDDIADLDFVDDRLVCQGTRFSEHQAAAFSSCPLVGVHVTWWTHDRNEYKKKLTRFRETMKRHADDCIGYAHAEVIRPEWDHDLIHVPFDKTVRYPVKPFVIEQDVHPKVWDIHISARLETLDPRLEQVLITDANMYSIDLKKTAGIYRIYTIQGRRAVQEGLKLFETLKSYLVAVGGMEGSIKYEQTCFWDTYGSPQIVPPTTANVDYF